jgi:hypothetical protein
MKTRRPNEEYLVASLRKQIMVLETLLVELHAQPSVTQHLEHRISKIETNLRVLRQDI